MDTANHVVRLEVGDGDREGGGVQTLYNCGDYVSNTEHGVGRNSLEDSQSYVCQDSYPCVHICNLVGLHSTPVLLDTFMLLNLVCISIT